MRGRSDARPRNAATSALLFPIGVIGDGNASPMPRGGIESTRVETGAFERLRKSLKPRRGTHISKPKVRAFSSATWLAVTIGDSSISIER